MLIFGLVPNVFAADILHRLTHGDQSALVLGSVLSINDRTLVVNVKKVISGKRLPSKIKIGILEPADNLEKGDYVVVSVNKKGATYKVKWGVFKVSSVDFSTLKVTAGPLPAGDLAAFQRYINSGGKDKNFFFVENKAFLRNPDGTATQIYPLTDQKTGSTKVRTERIKPQ